MLLISKEIFHFSQEKGFTSAPLFLSYLAVIEFTSGSLLRLSLLTRFRTPYVINPGQPHVLQEFGPQTREQTKEEIPNRGKKNKIK